MSNIMKDAGADITMNTTTQGVAVDMIMRIVE
jgi:hypothetical protein